MATPFTLTAVRAAGGRLGSARAADPYGDHSALETEFLYYSAGWELTKAQRKCPQAALTEEQVQDLTEVLR